MTPKSSPAPRSGRGQIGRPAMRVARTTPGEGLDPWLRGARLFLAITNPFVAVLSVVLAIIAGRVEALRTRAWWILAAGVVSTAAALLLTQLPRYATPWRELFEVLVESARARRSPASSLGETIADRWPEWIVAQLSLGLPLTILTVGLWLTWRRRYDAHWRKPAKKEIGPKEIEAAKKRLRERDAALAASPEKVPAVTTVDDLVLTVGVDHETGEPATLPAHALGMHSVITGPTGFGKTTTVTRITSELLVSPAARDLKLPAVIIDMKGDAEFIDYCRDVATATGRRFHLVTVDPEESDHYNPLRHGDASEIMSKVVEAEANASDGGFSEPHHRKSAEDYLLLACEVLTDLADNPKAILTEVGVRRRWRRDYVDLTRLMRPDALGKEIDRLTPEVAEQVRLYIEHELQGDDGKDTRKSISGMRKRLSLIARQTRGTLVDTVDGVDLYDAIKAGDIVLFSLDAMQNAAVARRIGCLAVQDLTFAFSRLQKEGYRKKTGKLVWTMVDEFSALGGSLLLNLYSRARSAGGAIALITQVKADLEAVSPEFATAVETNANVWIFHREKGSGASERSEALGTYETWEETAQVLEDNTIFGRVSHASGQGSLRMVDKFRIHPNEFKNLAQGEIFLCVAHPDNSVTKVSVVPAPPLEAPTTKTKRQPKRSAAAAPVVADTEAPDDEAELDELAVEVAAPQSVETELDAPAPVAVAAPVVGPATEAEHDDEDPFAGEHHDQDAVPLSHDDAWLAGVAEDEEA